MDKVPSFNGKAIPEGAEWTWKLMSAATWPDFEKMFEKHKGCCGGCWCAYHICPSSTYNSLGREGRKALHKTLVEEGRTSGAVCFLNGVPVGWCQFAPAPVFEQINRGKEYQECLRRDGTMPQWRITCVFVDKEYRGMGLSKRVLAAGVDAIKSLGGGLTEAYPMEVPGAKRPQYTGSVSMYEAQGFRCVTPMGKRHFIMRAVL
jgi:GNAT superfamily N-acetyltransferase